MADWQDVEKRAREETAFANEIAKKGATHIEQFYPELHSSPGTPSFTNTLGSYLVPDLLTSQTVLVDLYDWPSPDSLIKVYGVDLPFLLTLRDAKLVHFCANLPTDRYQSHSWLIPLLADSRTIFRSIRTPAFLGALDPDFTRRVSKRRADFERYFASLAVPEVERLCGAVKAARPPNNAASLASVLAQWLERLASFRPDLAAELSHGFEHDVVGRTPELMRLQRLIVSPHTAALGGMMKVERSIWATLFGEEGIDDAIMEGQVRLQALNTYFSEVQLSLDAVDLTNEQLWNTIRHVNRDDIIDHLSDTERKADLLAVEEQLRVGLIAGGDRDPTRDSIQAYVDKLEAEVENLSRFTNLLGIAASTGFSFLSQNVLVGVGIATGFFSRKYLLGDCIRRATEGVIGKIRVVRVLGKRDKL
jgi:hypothetical protein